MIILRIIFLFVFRINHISLYAVLMCIYPSITSAVITPFSEEALTRGIVYTMQGWPQSYGHLGFGTGFADIDGDGDADIVIVGAADGHVGLFENDGTGHYIDRSVSNGIPTLFEGAGFVAFDYDGDGDLDLYFTQIGIANILLRNEGDFTFTAVTLAAGIGGRGAGESASSADFDNDGWLDLYVSNYTGLEGTTQFNKLYRNTGLGSFEDVSVLQTVDDPGYSFQSVWSDYDLDGDVDLYLSNDRFSFAPYYRTNQLWRNDDGQLVNVSVTSGADEGLFSMGVASGDFDGNGWPDFYCTNIKNNEVSGYYDGYNRLSLNQGDGTFVESAALAGVESWKISWGAIFFDFDNDGHQDLYVNHMFEPNSLFDCNGTFPCTEIGVSAAVTASAGTSFSSAVADVDADGDLDLLVNNLGGNVQLFINNNDVTDKAWVRYRMIGLDQNVFAIGANTNTRTGSTWQLREVLASGNGYLGQNEFVMHVGLNDATVIDEVQVSWPGGLPVRTLVNLPVNQTWTLYPPEQLGDASGDSLVLLEDFTVFAGCYNKTIEPGCEMMDFNGDSTVNATDFNDFLTAYSGILADCNTNAINDMQEILDDPALDLNTNGQIDSCESGDTVPPNVEISSPATNTILTEVQPVDITASATDNEGIQKVEFYRDSLLQSTDLIFPYTHTWDVINGMNGSYEWTARAQDLAGNYSAFSDTVTLIVDVTVVDNTPPSANITSPAPNTLFDLEQLVVITSTANDDIGVEKVDFFLDGFLLSTVTTAPYTHDWNVTNGMNGSYEWTVRAQDLAGNYSAFSDIVTLIVNISSGGDTIPVAPNELAATAGHYGGKDKVVFIDLSWKDNSDNEEVFVIERTTQSGRGSNKSCGVFVEIDTVASNTNTYHDDSVGKSQAYCYRISARNSVGDSGYSNLAIAKTAK